MPQKILIVDDEDYIRLLIEETLGELEDKGVELLTAKNGVDALEIIETETPQLVFLDVMMPLMNGYDVCKKVKKELKLDDVCIVILTARGIELAVSGKVEVGADFYMSKPFNPDDILKRAYAVLNLS